MGEEQKNTDMPFVLRYTKRDRFSQVLFLLFSILVLGTFALCMAWCCLQLMVMTMPEREPTKEQIELIQEQNREILDMLGDIKGESDNGEGTEN